MSITTNHLLTSLRKSLTLSGGSLLNHILEQDRPDAFVKNLSGEDFFWLIKQIGEEDCLPILKLAEEEQWQYILDLESWNKYTIDREQTLAWFHRFCIADSERFASWVIAENHDLLSLLLLRITEVVIKDGEGGADPPEGYFSLDGRFYIRTFHLEEQEAIEGLLQVLAQKDHEYYQSLLYNLAGLIPAELEEELYRLRNGRIAEYGFIPFEEALEVYAPLDTSVLRSESAPLHPGRLSDPERGELIPLLPLMHVSANCLLAAALSRIEDPLLLDRIRLEFSGICNRIIAADSLAVVQNPELLVASCKRTAAYLNLSLEQLCNQETAFAAELLREHSLLTIFRVGYGFAKNLQHNAKRWRRDSWFVSLGWDNDFWGTPWGKTLDGLLTLHPRFFAGGEAPEPYCDFEKTWHLEKARQRLNQVHILDRLLKHLSAEQPAEHPIFATGMTFHFLLFNRWARAIMGMDISASPISMTDAKSFFRIIRRNEAAPPYRMHNFGEIFVAHFIKEAVDFEQAALQTLCEALTEVWDAFRKEYENVEEDFFDNRYSPFLFISP